MQNPLCYIVSGEPAPHSGALSCRSPVHADCVSLCCSSGHSCQQVPHTRSCTGRWWSSCNTIELEGEMESIKLQTIPFAFSIAVLIHIAASATNLHPLYTLDNISYNSLTQIPPWQTWLHLNFTITRSSWIYYRTKWWGLNSVELSPLALGQTGSLLRLSMRRRLKYWWHSIMGIQNHFIWTTLSRLCQGKHWLLEVAPRLPPDEYGVVVTHMQVCRPFWRLTCFDPRGGHSGQWGCHLFRADSLIL